MLDPIDGTRGFVGLRQYAICLGLLDQGEVRLLHPLTLSCPLCSCRIADGNSCRYSKRVCWCCVSALRNLCTDQDCWVISTLCWQYTTDQRHCMKSGLKLTSLSAVEHSRPDLCAHLQEGKDCHSIHLAHGSMHTCHVIIMVSRHRSLLAKTMLYACWIKCCGHATCWLVPNSLDEGAKQLM